MEDSSKGPNKVIIGLVVVALLAIIGTATVLISANNKPTNSSSSEVTQSGSSSSPNINSSASYKDGSYTARGSYLTPGGTESIDVNLTLKNNVVSDASIKQNAISAEAHQYQALFASGFKQEVVGKKIDSISLTRVSGSSLTPNGFNNALGDIKSQAKA